ncbi:MAG: 23S rRNA pseudouridine(955/2504/2580) synthase RluC [Gammaproteobacteria bacterium]|nr:23S rRNA pseudouridine(955/2504/2580) synthase RluC [Gammaproteobacteria bacterium]
MSESQSNKPAVRMIEVDEEVKDQRIDNFLISQLKGVPRSLVYRIVRRGEVRVNKGRVKAGYRLQPGDVVRIPPVRMAESVRSTPNKRYMDRLNQSVIFEDERFLVLNKPSGMAVHGGSGISQGVIETLRAARTEKQQLELVHRLDRYTSGCLLVSKKRSALRILHEMLRVNQVQKRYLALLGGSWSRDRIDVKEPLLKNTLKSGERMVQVDSRGKKAHTEFRVLQRFQDSMLVQARLMTGRTHQIRVHSAHLGTSILGDEKYGDVLLNREMRSRGLKRLFLHAESLEFCWPGDGESRYFKAPLEPQLKALLDRLKKESQQ